MIKNYILQMLIAVDQLFNTFLAGYADETLSSRCYRLKRDKVTSIPCNIIDAIFFFDTRRGKQHCQLAYESEKKRYHLPAEMRKKKVLL